MSWYKITNNSTGEFHYSASLAGEDLTNATALAILGDRCPEAFETVDAQGNIVINTAKQADILEEAEANKMDRRVLIRRAVRRAKSEIIDDMRAENVITAAQANRLRARLGA